MPKTILDRYNDAGDAGKVGSNSIKSRPVKKTFLIPVWDTDAGVGRVSQVSDVLSDNVSFVNSMVLGNAYLFVADTPVYDESDNLVSADIIWADGVEGTLARTIDDGNGSYTDTLTRTIPGGATTTYYISRVYDGDGLRTGDSFGSSGEGMPQLDITEEFVPFTLWEGDTPDQGVTNTGIQAFTIKTTSATKEVHIVCPEAWEVSVDDGKTWDADVYVDATETVNVLLKLVKEAAGVGADKLQVIVGEYYTNIALTYQIGDGQTGTEYPVLIPAQLDAVRDNLDKEFIQIADIDLAAYTNWVPIGESGDEFAGTYNGGGYKITGLVSAPATGRAGLFGVVGLAAIADLEIEDGAVTSVDNHAGMLCAEMVNYGATVSGCIVSGTVFGHFTAGGMFGTFYGAITECGADVDVTGTGDTKIGGLAGVISGAMTKCYALGDVLGVGSFAGGLGGYLNTGGTIADSYARGDVSATTSNASGGLMGGTITGAEDITNSYSSGAVTNGTANGGLVGIDEAPTPPLPDPVLATCVWDKTVNPTLADPSYGADGYTTVNMWKVATYTALGWDFTALTGEWTIDEDNDYPRLAWESA